MRFPLFEGLIYQCDSLSHGWGRTLAFFSLQSCLEFLCQHATSLSLSSCCCTVFPAAGAAVAYHLALGWGAPVRVLCIVVGKEPKQCHAFPPDDGKHCGIHRWSFPAASSRAVCLFICRFKSLSVEHYLNQSDFIIDQLKYVNSTINLKSGS